MKSVLLVLCLLFTPLCYGKTSVKLTGELGYQFNAKKVPPPTVGLGIWQSLGKKFAYNSWTGLGHQARLSDPTVQWFATKHDLTYYVGQVELSVGYVYKNASQENALEGPLDVDEHGVRLKLAFKLL